MIHARSALPLLACVFLLGACRSAPVDPPPDLVAVVEAFRAARADGRLDDARALLAEDPRVWYGERSGAGSPWRLEGGRWSTWDRHFRGESRLVGDWTVTGGRVSGDMHETNDYFRLTERGGGWWRATWFLDDAGRIEGFLVSSIPERPSPEGRADEFRAWAFATHPEEAEYLMPGGELDPTGDRPPRMRALLEAWRAEVGLPPLEAPSSTSARR